MQEVSDELNAGIVMGSCWENHEICILADLKLRTDFPVEQRK
jgi:hypothetical protein